MWLTVVSIFILVGLDQASKCWAIQVLQPLGSMPFWPGVMQLTYTLNDGAAFSLFAGQQRLLIAVTSVALLALLGFVLWGGAHNAFSRWGLILILGGGLSNLLDRLLNGQVVDYFDVTFMNYAVFNLADCFVTVGCALLFIGILFGERLAARRAKKALRTAQKGAADDLPRPVPGGRQDAGGQGHAR